jgi:hypothetical protein
MMDRKDKSDKPHAAHTKSIKMRPDIAGRANKAEWKPGASKDVTGAMSWSTKKRM